MLEARTKVLVNSIKKLYRRSAWKNIRRILNKTHAADIAALFEELDKAERIQLFSLIPSIDTKAEVISHLEPRLQKEIILNIDKDEVKYLVSEMESDDAADLLGSLPKEQSQEILDNMERESSEDVADLMRYPEDSAGGIMSTDFLAMNQNLSVSDAIKSIQSEEEENLVTFYIYVVDDDEHLVGVLSLKELILSKPSVLLKNIMNSEIISVNLNTDQEDVAKIVERYDYLSLPVVNDSQKLEGIITVDDIIDVIRAEGTDDFLAMGRTSDAEEEGFVQSTISRLPWLIFSFTGGLACFYLVYYLSYNYISTTLATKWVILSGMIPVLLSLGSTAGGQSATLSVGLINAGKLDSNVLMHFLNELMRSIVYAIIFSTLFYIVTLRFEVFVDYQFILPIILGAHIILATVIGSSTPYIIDKMKLDPSVGSVPVFTVLADIVAVGILLTFVV